MRTLYFILLFSIAIVLIQCTGTTDIAISLEEPNAPQVVNPIQNWTQLDTPCFEWGYSDERYHREYIPTELQGNEIRLSAWRNERVNAQAVVWSKQAISSLRLEISELKATNGDRIKGAIRPYYVRNVIADEFLGGCGYKKKSQETAHLVPDCLEELCALKLRNQSTRGIWFNIDVPKEAAVGNYTCEVALYDGRTKLKTIDLQLNVLGRTLPDASLWSYQLDLWQNPYAVARMHEVSLWSDEHFELMQPLFKMLANAGQKSITTTVVHKAWGGQTYDPFGSMVKHTLLKDGSWQFDYSIFDKWVEFMMDLGIDQQIKCFSLIPWKNQLAYFDETLGCDTFIVADPRTEKYADYWIPFLKDFKQHLVKKGWFDITSIAMDERPMESMKKAINLIQEYGGFKIASAANYNPGISEHIYDLSVESKHILPDSVLKERRLKGQITTYYVCCSEDHPNNFTFSPPAEGVWQGWYAYAKEQDGFLRWAYNSWVKDPMSDTRFRTWPAGDTFFVYPGAKSSIRFEKLREGIQDYEKLKLLVNELEQLNTEKSNIKLQELESFLKRFTVSSIEEHGAKELVSEAKKMINEI